MNDVVYSSKSTWLGALVGGIAGYLLAKSDEDNGRALGVNKEMYVGGATAVFAGVGAFIGRGLSAKPATATPSSVVTQPPLVQGVSLVSSGAITITLDPSLATISQALDVNTAVIIYLPQGAQWQSMDGAGITDRTSPQAFVFNGPISHTFAWTDATNTARMTTIFLTVAAAPQTVTT